jgi:hypothetical protein
MQLGGDRGQFRGGSGAARRRCQLPARFGERVVNAGRSTVDDYQVGNVAREQTIHDLSTAITRLASSSSVRFLRSLWSAIA